MNFYKRYLNGKDCNAVYNDIYSLGADAFNGTYFEDVNNVLIETFNRVAYNLDIIYHELQQTGYVLNTDSQFNFQRPLLKPLPDTDKLLITLDDVVNGFGYVPYSLKLFYKIVGSCNFGWDYEANPNILWQLSDPLQINSLNDLLDEVTNEDWKEYMNDILADGYEEFAYLDLAADYLHKDNISGGPAYAIQLTTEPAIDNLFLNEPNQTTFINYLRIAMDNCGFPGIKQSATQPGFHEYFDKVGPQLKKI
ncbi:hypothetical protein [Mucilaginibacter dorajii]|uniref:Uncharacterized protein n=1 Tax=Mucilaginibacter dorajii TaxID=692994 RepID=A0ABP7P2A4_9SPHI|nr:hypothetical protein [Mucilaginibacter dorajii]MCS3737009.1 hypothetical protein [Mucilaginibacter dorajii]